MAWKLKGPPEEQGSPANNQFTVTSLVISNFSAGDRRRILGVHPMEELPLLSGFAKESRKPLPHYWRRGFGQVTAKPTSPAAFFDVKMDLPFETAIMETT